MDYLECISDKDIYISITNRVIITVIVNNKKFLTIFIRIGNK